MDLTVTVNLLLSLGLMLVVPLALALTPAPRQLVRLVRYAAVPAALALWLVPLDPERTRPAGPNPAGVGVALLLVPWLVLVAACALTTTADWWRWWRTISIGEAVRLAAVGYLVVAAGWLVLTCAWVRPLGFDGAIVRLTAVHFHFAGVATCALAAGLIPLARQRRAATVGALLVAAAPPVVALGHLTVPFFELAGAVLTTVGVGLVAWTAATARTTSPRARWLLRLAALAPALAMLLALQYAAARALGTAPISYQTMAAVHGTLNGVGFVTLGLLGVHRARRAGRSLSVDENPGILAVPTGAGSS